MRDIKSGSKTNERFRTSENVEKVSVTEMQATYLFTENNMITLMKNENYEQFTLSSELLVGNIDALEDGMKLSVELIDEKMVSVKLPKSLKVLIQDADAVVKGQTASSSFKMLQRLII